MNHLHRRRSFAVAAAAMLLATGCAADTDNSPAAVVPAIPADPAPPSTPAPTPAATPTLSPSDAAAAARTAVNDYLALIAEISADPERELAELEQVAAGRALDRATRRIANRRLAGRRGTGAQVVADFTAANVVLGADAPMVELTACVDISGADVVGPDGESVVAADRPDRMLVDYVVTIAERPDERPWLVTRESPRLTDSNPPGFESCD